MSTQHSTKPGTGVPGPEATVDEKVAWLECQGGPLDGRGVGVLRAVYPAIMRAYYKRVYRRILKWNVEPAVAEELLQEVFMELFDRIARCGVQPNLRGMIGRLTKGHLLHHVRTRQRTPESVALPSSGSAFPESSADLARAVDYRAVARRLLPELSPAEQVVVKLCILEDKTDAEAAEALGIPEGSLKTQLAAIKHTLLKRAARLVPKSQRAT